MSHRRDCPTPETAYEEGRDARRGHDSWGNPYEYRCDEAASALESAGRDAWVAVGERLPKPERFMVDGVEEVCDFVPVLFHCPTAGGVCAGRFFSALSRKEKNFFVSLQGKSIKKSLVTHWMPLPAAPTGSGT